MALERDDRRTETELLRQQVEGEAAERAGRQRAEVVAEPGPIHRGEDCDHRSYDVTNAGPAVARDVVLEVRLGDEVVAKSKRSIAALAPSERRAEEVLDVPAGPSRAGALVLWAPWTDGTGPRASPLLEIGGP